MSKYKLIQLTNNNIGVVAANTYMPLGNVTRRFNAPTNNPSTFYVASSTSDIIYLNEPGYYKVTYSADLTAGAAGLMSISLVVNGNSTYTVAETAAAAEDIVNLTLSYVVRVCPNSCSSPYNCPVSLQFELGDVATGITPSGSTTNLIVEEVY
jgi:hypothetical protein